jgi:hypothetical protein
MHVCIEDSLRLTPTIKGIFNSQIVICLYCTVDALSIDFTNLQQGNAFTQWRKVVVVDERQQQPS